MNDVRLWLPFFVAVAAAPALIGCDPSLDLIHVPAGCPDQPLRGPAAFSPAPPEDVIDDFEDDLEPNDLTLNRVGGRTGSWVGYATPGMGTVFGEVSDKCVASGKKSGHLTGNNLVNYGGNWNGVLIDSFAQAWPFDARAYSGFSFWVATGVNAQPPLEMPIGVMTRDTSAGAGICAPCGDYYKVRNTVQLTTTWTRWVVKFEDMRQGGTGQPQVPLRQDQLVSIMIWPMKSYDIWIDDVRFERY